MFFINNALRGLEFKLSLDRHSPFLGCHYVTMSALRAYKEWFWYPVQIDINDPSFINKNSIDQFLKTLEFSRVEQYLIYAVVYTDKGAFSVCKGFSIDRNTTSYYIQEKLAIGMAHLMDRYDSPEVEKATLRFREMITPSSYRSHFVQKPLQETATLKRIDRTLLTETYAPLRIELAYWGELYKTEGNTEFFHYSDSYDLKRTYLGDNKYQVSVLLRKENGKEIFDFIDFVKDNKITRQINNDTLYIENGKVVNMETKHLCKYITSLAGDYIDPKKMNNLITYDIETYIDKNGVFIPYACGWCIGTKTSVYLLKDFESPQAMIRQSFTDLLIKQHHKMNIYIHNNKNFDAYFIVKALLESPFYVKPLFRDGKMISIKVVTNRGSKNAIQLQIIDSYMVLPASLSKLAKAFNCPDQKDIFPYNFVKLETLNYKGGVPGYDFFNKEKVSFKEYVEYKERIERTRGIWDLWEQTSDYLQKDLTTLYQVMVRARETVYKNYTIDICKVLSVSSLSFKVFRKCFMGQIPKDILENMSSYSYNEWKKIRQQYTPNIPIITKRQLYNDLRKAYYGGLVDVYIPRGKNLYKYDKNSMYPFCMLNDMPIGEPVFSTDVQLDNYFGFCYAEVKTPEGIKVPVLPYMSKDGRLVCPVGKWAGWYFSEELKNARDNFGYQIQVVHGYKFERGKHIFKNFVEHFYELKNKFSESGLGVIAKFLLNTLYGRFALRPELSRTEIVSQVRHETILKKHSISSCTYLGEGYELISYSLSPDSKALELHSFSDKEFFKEAMSAESINENLNISIPIAAAITAYARIELNKYNDLKDINGHPIKIYYRDTDSVVLSAPLPKNQVGTGLGQMKLEYQIKEGIFIAPKLYYLHVIAEPPQKDVIVKARGIGGDLTLPEFELLYSMQTISRTKDKWFTDIIIGGVTVKKISLHLSPFSLKRYPIFKDGRWVDTTPIWIEHLRRKGIVSSKLAQIVERARILLLPAPPQFLALPAPILIPDNRVVIPEAPKILHPSRDIIIPSREIINPRVDISLPQTLHLILPPKPQILLYAGLNLLQVITPKWVYKHNPLYPAIS